MTIQEPPPAAPTRPAKDRPLAGGVLCLIGAVHVAVTPLLYGEGARSILAGGVVASVEADPALEDLRAAAFWYITSGLGILLVGALVATLERDRSGVPALVGVGILVVGAWGALLMPWSGFWAFIAPAALILSRARHRNARATAATDVWTTTEQPNRGGHGGPAVSRTGEEGRDQR